MRGDISSQIHVQPFPVELKSVSLPLTLLELCGRKEGNDNLGERFPFPDPIIFALIGGCIWSIAPV